MCEARPFIHRFPTPCGEFVLVRTRAKHCVLCNKCQPPWCVNKIFILLSPSYIYRIPTFHSHPTVCLALRCLLAASGKYVLFWHCSAHGRERSRRAGRPSGTLARARERVLAHGGPTFQVEDVGRSQVQHILLCAVVLSAHPLYVKKAF